MDNMRICSSCNATLSLDYFRKRSMNRGLERVCKTCWRERERARMQIRIASGYTRVDNKKRACKARIDEIKLALGCKDCGFNSHPAALDFDHLPGFEKSDTVATLVGAGKLELALAEIDKCEVVCANCHRIRTAERKQYSGKPQKPVNSRMLERAKRLQFIARQNSE
jgi:hypothetical protein